MSCDIFQFSSVHFDLITQEMLHFQYIGGFHAGPDGDDIITDIIPYVHYELYLIGYIQASICPCFRLSDRSSGDDLVATCIQTKVYAARTEWYNLGLELGLRHSTLDSIDVNCSSDPTQCFKEVLKKRWKGPSLFYQAVVNPLCLTNQTARPLQHAFSLPLSPDLELLSGLCEVFNLL